MRLFAATATAIAASSLGIGLGMGHAIAQDQDPKESEVPDKHAEATEDDPKVFFEFDEYDLTPQARETLDLTAEWAKEDTEGKIVLEGHADQVGPWDYNVWLSGKRADAAKSYLLDKGVESSRIETLALGEKYPVNETQALNRRVIVFAEEKPENGEQKGKHITEMEQDEQQKQQAAKQQPQAEQEPGGDIDYVVVEEHVIVPVAGQDEEGAEQQKRQPKQQKAQPEQKRADEGDDVERDITGKPYSEKARSGGDIPEVAGEPDVDYDDGEVHRSVGLGEADDAGADHLVTPIGLSVNAGGGVVGFTSDDTNDLTDPGGIWTARLTVGTRTRIAGEFGYVGTAQSLDAAGLDDDTVLVSNGAESAARFNVLTGSLQPYLLGGLGFAHYDLVNEGNQTVMDGSDNVFYIPLAAGIGFRYAGALIDLRATYRAAWDDEMLDEVGINERQMDTLSASAKLGWEF